MTEEKKYEVVEKEDADETGYIILRNDRQGYASSSPTTLYTLEEAKQVMAEFIRKGMAINEAHIAEATLVHHREVRVVSGEPAVAPKQPSLILAP